MPVAGRPVFTTAQDGWIAGPSWAGIYSTRDGGRTWQGDGPSLENLNPTLPTGAAYGEIVFADADRGFLPIHLGPSSDAEEPRGHALALYITGDGGRTWKRDRVLTDHSELSRIGASAVVPGPAGAGSALLAAFNDRKHSDRVTLLAIGQGETTADAAPAVNSDHVLWRQGDDIADLIFVAATHGWAKTSTGDLLLTTDGGATWRDISPIPLSRPIAAPKTSGPRVKAAGGPAFDLAALASRVPCSFAFFAKGAGTTDVRTRLYILRVRNEISVPSVISPRRPLSAKKSRFLRCARLRLASVGMTDV